MSSRMPSSEELDVTVSANLADLEKTLIQVKSLRYQIYSKYLSEKLSYESQLRNLETEIAMRLCESNHSTQMLSLNDLRSSRTPLEEKSGNLSHMSTKTTEEKGIQTIQQFSSLSEAKNESLVEGRNQVCKPRYDENLFSVVEQLEYLIKP